MNERDLADTLIEADLFGAQGLDDSDLPPSPDHYQLVGRLGQGGAGAVYLARDRRLGRLVAMKYLREARPAEVERFLREARFAARLNDPGIVQIYEAGEIDGLPYIAMQYIRGGSLASAELDEAGLVRVALQVAGALAHAHDEGIVHRDIKPENILLDDEGRAYVTDFGIARDLREELGATISHDGQILGTPALMAPEQARGAVSDIDARTDVYALGATLYSKLAGRPPFLADNLVDLLHAVIHEEPPLPRRFRVSLARDLEAITMRCLQKRREARFQSMREVIEALEAHLAGSPGGAWPIWFTCYVRSRVADAPRAPEPEPDSDRDLRPALEAAQAIAAWDTQLYRVRGDLMRHYPKLDELIARLDRVVAVQPAAGWARFYRGVARFRRGDLRGALEDLERAIDRVGDLAGAYFELGRLYLAIFQAEYHAAHRHLSQTGTIDHLRHARSRLEQAAIAFEEARRLKQLPEWQARYAEAVRRLADGDFDGCVAACGAILAEDPDLEEVWKLQGDALRRAGRDPLPAYERAVAVRRSFYEALLAAAEVQLESGRFEEARVSLSQALEIHSGLDAARALMARTYLAEARASGAAGSLARASEIAAALEERRPDLYDAAIVAAECAIERARVSGRAGEIEGALRALDRAEGLEGCTNRVEYLRGRARLERARLAAAAGGEARADLEAVLAWRDHDAARTADNEPWLALFAEAERLLARLDGLGQE
jgi:predicted Ser/Thr protein kinase